MLSPNSGDRGLAHLLSSSHQSGAPMSRILRLGMQCSLDDLPDLFIGDFRETTRTGSIFFKSGQAESQEPLSPKLHCRARDPKYFCYFLTLHSVCGHLNYPGTLNNTRRHRSATRPSVPSLCFGLRNMMEAALSSRPHNCSSVYYKAALQSGPLIPGTIIAITVFQ
jgi:hypothetical protein